MSLTCSLHCLRPMASRRRTSPARLAPKPTLRVRSSVGAQILRKLRERILNWYYPPGAHLGEQALCEEFSSSRIPVREALKALAEQGLVDQVPNSGCYVNQPDLAGLHQLYDFRLALELFVVERLALTGPPEDLVARVKAEWEPWLHIRADAPVDGDKLVQADEAFHLGLARAIDNPYVVEALEDVNERLRFVRRVVITTPHRLQDTAGEHLAIVDALKRKDAEKARRALWQNINHARNKVELALARALTSSHQKRR
jgi:DNA-binding GntR family transcriptional regulator